MLRGAEPLTICSGWDRTHTQTQHDPVVSVRIGLHVCTISCTTTWHFIHRLCHMILGHASCYTAVTTTVRKALVACSIASASPTWRCAYSRNAQDPQLYRPTSVRVIIAWCSTYNLPTKIIPTKICWLKLSGKFAMDMRIQLHPLSLRLCLNQTLWNPEPW